MESALTSGQRLLATALLLSAAGALWLLLSPAASERRARMLRAAELRERVAVEWRYNVVLDRYRYGLLADPSVLEMEARRLGWGRPGERPAPVTQEEIRAVEARLAEPPPAPWRAMAGEALRALGPACLLLLAGAAALLFYGGLRIEEPLPRAERTTGRGRPA